MLKGLIDWYMATLDAGGYWLVALLMAIESSIVPLPSEVVIPPAAAHWYGTRGIWGMVLLVLAGAVGSWVGATAMYWASRLAGRPLVLRYGKYVMIGHEKVEGAERWAAHYGSTGIFISRLLPVVRHLIGIPAGIVRMNYLKFSLYTLLGSAAWCAVLCVLGITMGQDADFMSGKPHRILMWVAGVALALGVMYYLLVHRQMKGMARKSCTEA